MNILHTECSMNWGGQEYRTLIEHNYLNNNNHTSWIMCHPNSAFYQKAIKLGYKNIIGIDFSKSWRLNIAVKILSFCIKNKIDIINSHNSRDSILSLFAFIYGIPLIRSRQITTKVKKKLSYQFLCSHVIAAAHIIKKQLIEIGVDKKRITVVGEGIDLEEYNPNIDSTYLKKEFGLNDTDTIICNIGIIRSDKGQEYYFKAALEVLKKHPNTKFFLIGKGNGNRKLELKLQQMVKDYSLEKNFIMTGYRDDVASFIHISNMVVIASTGVEAQSRIAPQSFATRRAVVSTDTGGLTELVKDMENGLVIPAKDISEMSKAIIKLIEDINLRDKLALNGYKFAKTNLSLKNMMDKTIQTYMKFNKNR